MWKWSKAEREDLCGVRLQGRSLDPRKDDSLVCEYGNILVLHVLHSNADVPPQPLKDTGDRSNKNTTFIHIYVNKCGTDIVFTIFLLETDMGGGV